MQPPAVVVQIYLIYLAATLAVGVVLGLVIRWRSNSHLSRPEKVPATAIPEHTALGDEVGNMPDQAKAAKPSVYAEITQLAEGMALLKRRLDSRRALLPEGAEDDDVIAEMKKLYHRMRARRNRLQKKLREATDASTAE